MKKLIFVLLILIGLFMTSCRPKCETNLDCRDYEACIDGECTNTDCSDNCPSTGNPCSYNMCSAQTRNMCKEVAHYGSEPGCRGPVPDKECKEYMCENFACIEVDDTDCIRKKEYEARQIPCSDGTETGFCSRATPGMYCDEGKLVDTFKEYCLEELEEEKEEQKKEAPQLMSDPCGEVAHGACSPDQEGMRCDDGELVLDETCLPITECEDNTLIGECSEKEEGKRCNSEGLLELDEACLPDPQPEVDGCGDTLEGECSPDGRWCIHGELIADEACENACDDGTPNWGCSYNTIGYICEDGVLKEEPTCDPDYVWEPIDCEDGTEDGYCNTAETHWCDHGTLVELQEGESC